MKPFEIFKRGGIQFIAVPSDNGVSIIDQEGNNYGSYDSAESFEAFAARNGGFVAIRLGTAGLQIRVNRK